MLGGENDAASRDQDCSDSVLGRRMGYFIAVGMNFPAIEVPISLLTLHR